METEWQAGDTGQSQMDATQPTQVESFSDLQELMPASGAWGRAVSTSTSDKIPSLELFDESYKFGRKKACQVRIVHSAVSGEHCRIFRDGDAVFVEDLSTNGTWFQGKKIGKGNRTLIASGDEIFLLRTATLKISYVIYFFDAAQPSRLEGVHATYDIREALGTGAFAIVKKAIHRTTGEKYAMKIIEKKKFSLNHGSTRQNALMDEVKILRHLNHDHVIKIYDVFETEEYLYLVLELVTGGDLFDSIVALNGKGYPEPRARTIFTQMVEAVNYLHQNEIVHRDLKPENVLLARPGEDVIKLSDFGLSRIVGEGSFMKTLCGTPQYLAPEVLGEGSQDQGYDKAVDLWSLGVVLYVLLSGTPPFRDDTGKILDLVKKGKYSFPHKLWSGISKEGADLVKRLLCVDPSKRISVTEVKMHPWILGQITSQPPPTQPKPPTAIRTPENTNKALRETGEEGEHTDLIPDWVGSGEARRVRKRTSSANDEERRTRRK